MTGWRLVVAAAAVVVSLGTARPARAEFAEDAGWGILTVLANVGYMPVKVVYSVLGGLTGGLAYVCTAGDYQTASEVWGMSMGGTYVLTPPMIRGEESIEFAGSTSPSSSSSHGGAAAAEPEDTQSASPRGEETLPAS